jgi:hypothetical protein
MTQVTARSDWTHVAIGRRRTSDGRRHIRWLFCIGVGGRDRMMIGSPESLFEFQQLTHKIEIGRNDGTALLDHRVSLDQTQLGVTHQVSDGDGWRTRNARVTMDQNRTATATSFICQSKRKFYLLENNPKKP